MKLYGKIMVFAIIGLFFGAGIVQSIANYDILTTSSYNEGVTITSPTDGDVCSGNVYISWQSDIYSPWAMRSEVYCGGNLEYIGDTTDGFYWNSESVADGSCTISVYITGDSDLDGNFETELGNDHINVNIQNSEPLDACWTCSDYNPYATESVNFDGSCSVGEALIYIWFYTTPDNEYPVQMGMSGLISYSWDEPGTYYVTLRVTDYWNNIDDETKTITVKPAVPTMSITSPESEETYENEVSIIWEWDRGLTLLLACFNIYYRKQGGSWHSIIEDYIDDYSPGIYYWDVSGHSNGQYQIKVDWVGGPTDTSGCFTILSNNPPNTPNMPTGPISGTIGESLPFSTSTTDPDGDQIKYGWDWDDDNNVNEWSNYLSSGSTDSRSHSWNQEGSYPVKVKAEDVNGAQSSWSQTLTVTISEELVEPNLDCSGSLSWNGVKPDSLVTGSFTVRNIGDPGSHLNWKVQSYPGWGDDWTFTPDSGSGLTPEDGSVTVDVFVVAPDIEEATFSGEIMVINEDESSDFETISVSLSTPKSKEISNPLFRFLENHPLLFPLLHYFFDL